MRRARARATRRSWTLPENNIQFALEAGRKQAPTCLGELAGELPDTAAARRFRAARRSPAAFRTVATGPWRPPDLRWRRANFLLNGVAHVDQHLPEAAQPCRVCSRISRNRPVFRHEDVGAERLDHIEGPEPVEAVSVVDEQELVREIELAQIDDAICGTKMMLSPRVCARPR